MLRRIYCLLLSVALVPIGLAAGGKSVFDKASPSVVVVLAQDAKDDVFGRGSGVVVGEGIVVTNCHVIEEAAKIRVWQAADARGVESYGMDANVIARDEDNDLCLLLAKDLTKPPAARVAELGAAKGLAIGEQVYAIGTPKGLVLSMSGGIVAQLRGAEGEAPVVQTDAALSPGSSGGGLFNERGELIGITTYGRKGGENLNFAMPVEAVAALLNQVNYQQPDSPDNSPAIADFSTEQCRTIPVDVQPAPIVAPEEYYEVKKGDTLLAIAMHYGLDYRDLARWNNIRNQTVIQPGQRLRLTAPAAQHETTLIGAQPANPAAAPYKTEPQAKKYPYSHNLLNRLRAEWHTPQDIITCSNSFYNSFDVRLWSDATHTRLVLESDAPLDYEAATLGEPRRLFIDITSPDMPPEVINSLAQQGLRQKYISAVHAARNSPGTLRIVFDLSADVSYRIEQLRPIEQYRHRLVVDIAPK